MNQPRPPAKSAHSRANSEFRIIGGQWRSRKFHFVATPGLRPTPDRIRETLFNWLSNEISYELTNLECLDLFCGSGALGLEALSRGAKFCTFVDAEPQATSAINQHLSVLKCTKSKTLTSKLPMGLSQIKNSADLVFLDPPYQLDCLNDCLQSLITLKLLNNNAWIYVECSSKNDFTEFLKNTPKELRLHRNKTAGQVQYSLFQYQTCASLSLQDPL